MTVDRDPMLVQRAAPAMLSVLHVALPVDGLSAEGVAPETLGIWRTLFMNTDGGGRDGRRYMQSVP